MMKNIFKFLLITGLTITLNSCVPVNELEQNQDAVNGPIAQNPTDIYHPVHYNLDYYRAPDGAMYRKNDLYRDRFGNVYHNGSVVGKDPIFDHAGVIGHVGKENGYLPNNSAGMLPPVQFDNNSNGNNNQKGVGNKRSGANNYSNSFNNTDRNSNDNR